MKIGVTLPQFTDDPAVLVGGARRARAAGLDSVWLFDHMWPLSGGKQRPFLECYSALAYLAAAIDGITIGTLVTRSTTRNEALLAHMVATVADIAPGRVVIAIGSGDAASRPENDAFGLPYLAGGERLDQLEATVVAVRDHAGIGRRIRPPIWVGGRSRGVLDVAGRRADGWNSWGSTPEEWAAEAEHVRTAADGRAVTLTWAGLASIAATDREAAEKLGRRDPSAYVIGSPESIGRHLDDLAGRDCDHAIVTFPDAGRPGAFELLGRVGKTPR